MENIIANVELDSIAYELNIEKGDILISINDKLVTDVFDYRYLIQEEELDILIKKKDGEEWLLEIEKDEDEDLGITFYEGLMDNAKSCTNKCIFCFIDQLPKNMRQTLYFKDDDSRLSFLQGNYVTLTNMKETDLDRIIFYHLSPINISVHTTDPDLRVEMLKNKNAKNILSYIKKLYDNNISMNFQVVLCNNINDNKHLDKTIEDLSKYIPYGKSLSIVPIGISKHRDGLYPMTPFNKEDSIKVISQVHKWQEKFQKEYNTNFVYASDEFYLLSNIKMPKIKDYEDFPQIENGVGMITLMEYEFENIIKDTKIMKTFNPSNKIISVVTGVLASAFITGLCNKLMNLYPTITIKVHTINNDFFGENITVSGLLTGNDIIKQLENNELGDKLLIPSNAFRDGEEVFLDDVTIVDMENKLNIKVCKINTTSKDFIYECLT